MLSILYVLTLKESIIRRNGLPIFQQCEKALIIRENLINLHKVRAMFLIFLLFLIKKSLCFNLFLCVDFFSSHFCQFRNFRIFAFEFRMHLSVCRSKNARYRKLYSPLIQVLWKPSPSTYFKRRSPTCLKKYVIFDENFGGCLTFIYIKEGFNHSAESRKMVKRSKDGQNICGIFSGRFNKVHSVLKKHCITWN